MRFLADENFPLDAVEAMRGQGHDVVWIREETPGIKDSEVLARAQKEKRIVVTFDKDFGELAFHSKLPASSGVILFRITASSPKQISLVAIQVFAMQTNWEGHFSVIEDRRIRMTLLPKK